MLKKLLKEKPAQLNFKCTPAEYKEMTAQAKRFTNGNLSAWVRHAAINHEPHKSQLAELESKA